MPRTLRRTRQFSLSLVLITFFTAPSFAAAREVFGTKRGKVYHTNGDACASARKIQTDNKVTFTTEQEAKNAGRRLCKRCETLERQNAEKPPTKPAKEPDRPKNGGDSEGEGTGNSNEKDPPKFEPPNGDEGLDPIAEFAAATKILPGGTLVLDNGEHAALVGVTCPTRGQPCEKDAVRFITEQTRNGNLRLASELGSCHNTRRDDLGRLLVYITPERVGRDLGGELIFQGYAWVDRTVPFARQAEYLRYEDEAWRAKRGIWQRDDKLDTGGETVITGRHAHCYHPPTCRHAKLLANVMNLTLTEARARKLVPCTEYRGKK